MVSGVVLIFLLVRSVGQSRFIRSQLIRFVFVVYQAFLTYEKRDWTNFPQKRFPDPLMTRKQT